MVLQRSNFVFGTWVSTGRSNEQSPIHHVSKDPQDLADAPRSSTLEGIINTMKVTMEVLRLPR